MWNLLRYCLESSWSIFPINCLLSQEKNSVVQGTGSQKTVLMFLALPSLLSWTDCLTFLCFAFRCVKWGSSSLENTLGYCGNWLGCICFAGQKCNCSSCRLTQTIFRISDWNTVSTVAMTARNLLNTNKPNVYKIPDTFCSPY